MKKIINLLLSLMLAGAASCQETRNVKVTATEEDGAPIQGANALVTFLGYTGEKAQRKNGETDATGVFRASGEPQLRMYVRLEKSGYYTTESNRLSRKQDHDLKMVLRKIKTPIPLHAKKFRGKLPDIGNKHGFDFEIGDWVTPHGKGKIIDLLFEVNITKNDKEKIGGRVEITFPGKSDGLLIVNEKNGYLPLSALRMPNEAPNGQYLKSISREEFGYENKNKDANVSYFFRTREKEVKAGEYIFNYSKLNDGLNFSMGGGRFLEEPYRSKFPVEYGMIEFSYYFNPNPNDRNLEFDPKRNLFTNLEPTEQVREP